MTKSISVKHVCVGAAYLLAAVLYFTSLSVPHKLCFPLAMLFLASVALRLPILVCCAMGFSALGDYFGTCGLFLPQMGAFAVAHVALIGAFAMRWAKRTPDSRPLYTTTMALASLATMILALVYVIPSAPEGVIRWGAGTYAVIISGMMCMALLQRDWLFGLGAILFVTSDAVLGWNRFVAPLPAIHYLIMVPYYLGQLLLFLGFCRTRQ